MLCVQDVAKLKEEYFSILGESQYTHVHKLFNVTVVFLYTGIDDLFKVLKLVKQVVNWKDLGLALGLLYTTLQKIERDQRDMVDDCMREMLAAWLQQQDNVSKRGVPCWAVLKTTLEDIGENQLASEIDQ